MTVHRPSDTATPTACIDSSTHHQRATANTRYRTRQLPPLAMMTVHRPSDTATGSTHYRTRQLPPLAMMTVHRPSDTATPTACIDNSHRQADRQPTRELQPPVLIAAPTIRGQQAAPTIGHRHSHHTGRCAALPSLAIVTVHRPSDTGTPTIQADVQHQKSL